MSDPFDREVAFILEEMTSPKARSRMLATFAREEIAIATANNQAALGRTIRKPVVTVDGRQGAALGTVKPDGVIVAEFNIETDAVRWILREVELISPELTGAYGRSHMLFADGAEVTLAGASSELPEAGEYVIASDLPYAKKLDPKDGLPARSKQAPKGVYAAISAVAADRFAREASIRFTFRDVPLHNGGSARNPAITVRPL